MDKNRKNTHSTSTKLLKKKSVPLINQSTNKQHKHILSKSRNTLEQTRDTFIANKTAQVKNWKEGLTNYSTSTQATEPRVLHINSKLQENRMNTDYQNRFSIQEKILSIKEKSFLKKTKKQSDSKSKSRLSLNDKKCKKVCNNSLHKYDQLSLAKTTLSQLEKLAKQRENIQKEIKRSCKKSKIQKKDLLKITNQYEKLLDRFVFTEIPQNQTLQDYHKHNGITVNLSCLNQSSSSLQFQNEAVPVQTNKTKIKNLQLNNLKKMGIQDYNDEFMSHYQELSQSWKRDIDIQKRF